MSDWKNVQYKDGKLRTNNGGSGGASALSDLTDVNLSSPSDGQVLKYDSQNQKWINANESGGGGTVTDVTVDGTSVVNQQGVAEIETPDANGIVYDNQQSGLQATDVQSAIDEVVTKLSGIKCLYNGRVSANSSIEVSGFSTGAYLFFTADYSIRGGYFIYYEDESGLYKTELSGSKNVNIWSFTFVSGNKIRITLNNGWARNCILYKMM